MTKYTKEEKERFSFAKLPKGTEVLIHYKDGRKPEWFKYLGFAWTTAKQNQHPDKDNFVNGGFVIYGEPIRGTAAIVKDGQTLPVALFPEIIISIETADEVKPNSSHD